MVPQWGRKLGQLMNNSLDNEKCLLMEIWSCWWCTHESLQEAASIYSGQVSHFFSLLCDLTEFLKLSFIVIMSSSNSNASFIGIVKFTVHRVLHDKCLLKSTTNISLFISAIIDFISCSKFTLPDFWLSDRLIPLSIDVKQ